MTHFPCETVKPVSELEQLRRLAIVAQKTQNAVIITDDEGYIQWVNDAFTRLTGYSYNEVVGRLGYILQGEKTNREVVETIRTTMWARQPFSGEIYNYTKDGRGFWMSISITPVYDDYGKVEGFVAVQMDITELKAMEEQLLRAHSELEVRVAARTAELLAANRALQNEISERKRAEIELSEAQQFLRKVIDSVPNAIYVKDSTGRFTLGNTAMAEIYGTDIESLIGKSDADFCTDVKRLGKVGLDERQVLENLQEKIIYEEEITDAKGTTRWFQTIKRPLVFDGGNPHHLLCVATDLTERKILESKLRHAQKMESIGQLAAGIAHEINTPTQYVSDNTHFIREEFEGIREILCKCRNLLQKSAGGCADAGLLADLEKSFKEREIEYLTEEIPKAIEQSLEGLSRISKIVQSMRTFAHPAAIEMKLANLNKAIESTVTVAHNEWKYVADLEMSFDENLPLVPCLLDEFNQVILNMLINATHSIADMIEAGAYARGKITVTTFRLENQWAEVRISDTGAGIPAEARNRIFDPFFTTKEVGKGTGQGLAISHNVIVEKHKGQLSFETETGKGTTFILRIPLQNECL